MVRIQVLLSAEERERFRRLAKREGLSLSAWLRSLGRERLAAVEAGGRFRDPRDLDAFFAACDRREEGREPDWKAHLDVMRRSRTPGTSDT